MSQQRFDRLCAGALGIIAFLLYIATMCHGVFPGGSAELVASFTGLYPRFSPVHSLWGLVARAGAAVPIGDLATRINFISATFGALDVALVYIFVHHVIDGMIDRTARNARHALFASRLAGITAALFLTFSTPFWFGATRAHTYTFDIFLGLVVGLLFLRYASDGRLLTACILALTYGLALVEYASLVFFAPLYLFGVLFVLWRTGNFAAKPILLIAASLLTGYATQLLVAWGFYGSPGFEARGLHTYWEALLVSARDQGGALAASLPTTGWLLVLLTTGVPWLCSLCIAKRGLNQEREWTYYVLHAVMTAISIVVLLDIYPAPWPLFRHGLIIVLPYVLTAMVFGYLTAYWYLLATEKPDGTVLESDRAGWRTVALIIPLLCLLVATAIKSFPEVDTRPARAINRYVSRLVKDVGDRALLVTDGVLDHPIRITAAHRQKSLAVLNLYGDGVETHSRYLPAIFDETRFKNLAQIGVLPLLRGWLRDIPSANTQLAMLTKPDLLLAAGLHVVPEGLVFHGVTPEAASDHGSILNRQKKNWAALRVQLKSAEKNATIGAYATHVLRHMSLVANNLGVVLQDHHDPAGAYAAYSHARELHPGNLSALLNLGSLVSSGFKAPDADRIKLAIAALRNQGKTLKLDAWTLAGTYGYLRSPQAYATMGMVWALSGNPAMGDWGIQRALELSPMDPTGETKQLLAAHYMANHRYTKSAAAYDEILAADPGNVAAIMGLSRIATRNRDFQEARRLILEAVAAGLSLTTATYYECLVLVASGDMDTAHLRLQELVDAEPDNESILVLLADISMKRNDDEGLKSITERLEQLSKKGYPGYLALGQINLYHRDYRKAVDFYQAAYRINPRAIEVLDMLARVSFLMRRTDLVKKYSLELLRLDENNATGNFMMGLMRTAEHKFVLAEDYFSKSLSHRRDAAGLNEMAWALAMQLRYDEAEASVREALALNDKNSTAWDTLGYVLMRTARDEEAERALRTAIGLDFNNIQAILHLGKIMLRKHELDEAQDIVNYVQKLRARIPFELREEVDALERQLRTARDS